MEKLFNLKEWLTLDDAAKYLSIQFGEDVSVADVLRLGVDGRLRLSVYFVNHATAVCGKVVEWEDTEWRLLPNLDLFFRQSKHLNRLLKRNDLDEVPMTDRDKVLERMLEHSVPPKLKATLEEIPESERGNYNGYMDSLYIGDDQFLTLSRTVSSLSGVWDLPMIGAEKLEVEDQWCALSGGPRITLVSLEGSFVSGPDGQICQLLESFDQNEYQSGSLAQLEEIKQRIEDNNIPDSESKLMMERFQKDREEFLEKQRSFEKRIDEYYPGRLPEDSMFVVRTTALQQFIQTIKEGQDKKDAGSMGESEPAAQSKVMTLIKGLVELYYGADMLEELKQPKSKGVSEIQNDLKLKGYELDPKTLRKYLKELPD